MSDYSSLKATINANIKANNNHEITGAITNSVLNAMVNSLGAGYQFMGMATPTNPGTAQTPDYKCFYLATTPGTYTYLGGLVVADGEVAILKYDSSWHKEVTGAATAEQLNQLGQEVKETYGDYVENPEWVKVVTDSEDKILYGVKTDGKFYFGGGCPLQIVDYIQDKINELSLDEYEDIVTFLGDLIDGDTLATLLNTKLDKEGLDPNALETIRAVENPEYIQVTTDSEGKILEGITPEGVKQINLDLDTPSADIEHLSSDEWVYLLLDKEGKILEGVKKDGTKIINTPIEGVVSSEEIKEVEKDAPVNFDILPSPTIYGRAFDYTDSFFKFNNSVYAEGFVKDGNVKLKINGGRESRINTNVVGTSSVGVMLSSNTNKVKSINLQTINVKPSAVNGKAFVLCIGESTTAAVEPDPYKGNVGSWGWPSALRQYSLFDQHDNVGKDVVTLGTRGNYNRSVTYKNTSISIRSFNEGIPGWPSYCVLNWPCFAKFSLGDANANGFSARNMWYALGLASKTPYNASSYNSNREEYTGSAAQLTLMTQTPFGKYKVDGDSTTWALMQYLSGRENAGGTYPIFEDTTSTYSGSASQITMMQNFCDSLANNPMNRFYSLTEARSGSTGTAFSLDTYLSRYRTLDDAGNRLEGSAGETVIGGDGNTYTIGTKVLDTSAYDVCTPTHIILNVGINDSEANYLSNAVANIKTLVSQFSQPTAYFLTRMEGVCYTGDWGDVAVPAQYSPFTFNVSMLAELIEWFNEQSGKYLLPVYAIQYPCSVTNEFLEDTVDGKQIVNCKTSNIHPGVYAYRTIGFQCLSWIYCI